MKEIKLNGGYLALVSDADYSWLNQFNWFAMVKKERGVVVRVDAARNIPTGAKSGRRWINRPMQHDVLPFPWFGFTVDHADGNPLNNQRENLRYATPAQQSWNTRRKAKGSSGYRGVYRDEKRGKWRAELIHGGKTLKLGWFDDEADAARAWNAAAKEHRGDFARLNPV